MIREYGYVYDGVGNRTAERVDGVVTGATYNKLNQLTASVDGGPVRFSGTIDEPAQVTVDGEAATASDGGKAFERHLDLTAGSHTVEITATDASGNNSSRDYLLSTTAADSKTYTYDANGNLTSDRVRTFLWDADGAREREDGAPGSGVPGAKQRVSKAGAPGATDEQNRLISIIEGSKKSKFSYDGLGRRVRIRELDRGTETSNRTFVWSGTAIVEERNAAGTQASKRYYARGLVDRTGSEDKKYYYTFDHLGSTREVVEDDGTTVAARYEYDPFGRVEKLGGSYDVDFLYTGHFYHQPSGLYLTHYRAYDPDTGVWLSRDPLGYIDGPNPYAYVGNDPLGKFDPTGGAARCIKSQSEDELAEGLTFFGGVGANAAALLGFDGNIDAGLYFGGGWSNWRNWDIGLIFSGAVQGGVNAGKDVHLGGIRGSLQDQEGPYLFAMANVGGVPFSLTAGAIDNQQSSIDHYRNENDANNPLSSMDPNGWFGGVSFGPLPAGAGAGYGEARVVSLQGVIQRVNSWFDGDDEDEEED